MYLRGKLSSDEIQEPLRYEGGKELKRASDLGNLGVGGCGNMTGHKGAWGKLEQRHVLHGGCCFCMTDGVIQRVS